MSNHPVIKIQTLQPPKVQKTPSTKYQKPQSIKMDPWTDFPTQPYSIFKDDFVHEKLFVAKVCSKALKSTINFKATVADIKDGRSVSDQVKLWFALADGRSLYGKFKSSNYLKLQYDHGTINLYDKNWNFYGGINANKSIQNLSFRVGAAHLSAKCHSDNRLKIDILAQGKQHATLYNRTTVKHDKFTLGLLGVYSITNNLIQKNNILLGYQYDDNTYASVRAQTKGFRATPIALSNWQAYFDTVTFNVVASVNNDVKVGLEAVFNTQGKHSLSLAQFVVQHELKQHKLITKLKFCSKLDAALLFKFPSILFKNIATTSLGFSCNNIGDAKRSFGFGLQVEFNV